MNIEDAVRQNLCQVLDRSPQQSGDIDLDRDLFNDYGLTSLNMVVLMTSVCEATKTDLSNFTEEDIAAMKTPRQIILALEKIGCGSD